MKRVNFHLTEGQISALQRLSDETGLSSAELIRRAVDGMLQQKAAVPVRWETGGANSYGQKQTSAQRKGLRTPTSV